MKHVRKYFVAAGVWAMAASLGCSSGYGGSSVTAPPDPNTVNVGNDVFSGGTKTVSVGTTVTWSWVKGAVTHNVTFDDGQKSANMSSGTYTRKFDTPGTYNYHCTIHGPVMSGTITVQ